MQGAFNRPGFDPQVFNAVRDGSYQDIRHFDVDLSNARSFAAGTYLDIPVAADSIYVDANPSDGNATLYLQPRGDNKIEVPLYISPGFILNDQPFTRLRVENTAQPGKKVRIVYGVGARFNPGSVAQVAVSNNGGFTALRPEAATGFSINNALIVANGNDPIFSAASNVNGAIILSASYCVVNNTPAVPLMTLIAKATAPATFTDGEIILSGGAAFFAGGTSYFESAQLSSPQYIPAGKGLYWSSGNASAGGPRSCRYKLL